MGSLRSRMLTRALPLAFVLLLPALVAAHGQDETGDEMSGMSGMDMSTPEASMLDVARDPTYFTHSEHITAIYTHIVLSTLAWVVVLPLAIMLTIARSKLKVLAQFAFLAVNGVAIFASIVYNAQTPDLYENNSHHKIGWAVTWIASIWSFMGLLTLYTDGKGDAVEQYSALLQPMTQDAMQEYDQFQAFKPQGARWSGDSGQGTERNTNSLSQGSRSNSWNTSSSGTFPQHVEEEPYDEIEVNTEKQSRFRNAAVDGFLSSHVPRYISGSLLQIFNITFAVLTRFQALLGFLALMTGMVTFSGIAKGGQVFSVLAHFIKGGIFFWYGLLTLGRWMGCFADFGWAWNLKPGAEIVGKGKARIPTAEFTESFVIWLYGVTNVFLEHLSAWGDEWSTQDLEHVAITIMFAGGGMVSLAGLQFPAMC